MSCKSAYDVYISNPKIGKNEINGFELHKFFKNDIRI